MDCLQYIFLHLGPGLATVKDQSVTGQTCQNMGTYFLNASLVCKVKKLQEHGHFCSRFLIWHWLGA